MKVRRPRSSMNTRGRFHRRKAAWATRNNAGIGLPFQLTDATSYTNRAAHYRAWGNTLSGEPEHGVPCVLQLDAQIHQPVRFNGQYSDSETGLHYNLHRYYDPDLGRFLTQDPLGLEGDINLYRYAPNPNRWTDPLGLQGRKLVLPDGMDPLWMFGQLYQSLPGCFSVIAHGMRNGQVVSGAARDVVSPPGLANAIRSSPDYRPGMPVLLNACNSGKRDPANGEPYAQRLSNSLNAPVTAPNGVMENRYGVEGGQMTAYFLQTESSYFVEFFPQCRPRSSTL
jgi:RHS repeat-associated protein